MKFMNTESPCGNCRTGIIINYDEGDTVRWDCGCWQERGLNGYTHEFDVLGEGFCDSEDQK